MSVLFAKPMTLADERALPPGITCADQPLEVAAVEKLTSAHCCIERQIECQADPRAIIRITAPTANDLA